MAADSDTSREALRRYDSVLRAASRISTAAATPDSDPWGAGALSPLARGCDLTPAALPRTTATAAFDPITSVILVFSQRWRAVATNLSRFPAHGAILTPKWAFRWLAKLNRAARTRRSNLVSAPSRSRRMARSGSEREADHHITHQAVPSWVLRASVRVRDVIPARTHHEPHVGCDLKGEPATCLRREVE